MDPLAPLITSLNAQGRPRIWSLVITVFGDSVQHRGGRIATARLGRLLGRIGIETGALRTALSRLSRDGWVEGRREGRSSSYMLTQTGLAQFAAATARIYAQPRTSPVQTWVFGTKGDTGLAVAGGRLWPADRPTQATGFQITGALGPDSRADIARGLDPAHRTALQLMAQDIAALTDMTLTDPLDALAARTLLVHRWRRLVLRWPELPGDIMPPDIFDGDLLAAVAAQYARLSPSAETWLDTPVGDSPAMPKGAPAFAKRFLGAQIP